VRRVLGCMNDMPYRVVSRLLHLPRVGMTSARSMECEWPHIILDTLDFILGTTLVLLRFATGRRDGKVTIG
jgi:hypothetical protein